MPSTPSDEELMVAARGGDLGAFEQVVLRNQDLAWRVAYRYLGDRTEAEDVAQQAFLRILEAAPRYRPAGKFSTYLYQVVTRLCVDHVRKKRPVPREDLGDVEYVPSEPDGLSAGERDQAIRRALESLPANQRTALVLRHWEELGYREIAASMETTEKAVERLLSRARATLEELLSKAIVSRR